MVRAASTAAVPSGSTRYAAVRGRPRASTVATGTDVDGSAAATASRVPSPPSATATTRTDAVGSAARTPRRTASPAARLSSDPLNESRAATTRSVTGAAPRRTPTGRGRAAPPRRRSARRRRPRSGA